MVQYCAVYKCKNNTKDNSTLQFFRVPLSPLRRERWLSWMGRKELVNEPEKTLHNRRICSEHFHKNMFAGLSQRKLRKNAEPTIFKEGCGFTGINVNASTSTSTELKETPTVLEDQNKENLPPNLKSVDADYSLDTSRDDFTQTSPKLGSSTPRIEGLKSEVHNLKRRYLRLSQAPVKQPDKDISQEDFIKFCKKRFSEGVANFFIMQLDLSYKKPKGYRYTDYIKQFALTIYFLGPSVYRFLQQTFQLPSKATLCRMTSKWDISSGLNDFIFQVIATKVANLNSEAKDIILCADEMSLKTNLFYNRSKDKIFGFHQNNGSKLYSPANSVLVLMARGIHSKWKQPVAYFFVTNTCQVKYLHTIIFDAVLRLAHIGLRVRALITDQGANFLKFSKDVGVSPENPYFFVEENKIYYFFDIPHLLKALRNNFLKYILQIGDEIIDKRYVIDLYNRDKQMSFRMVPKLTNAHVNPTPFQKMNVSLAAQLLSSSVATGLELLISVGYLPQAAMSTANFVANVDKLFDVFNSIRYSSKDYNRPFVGSSQQINFLNNMKSNFQKMKLFDNNGKDVTNSMKFLTGWQTTITGFLMLWEDLQPTTKVLFTRRINQDCLENFFGTTRQQSGNNLNPTPIQFHNSFKKLFCLNFFQHAEGANCMKDMDELLSNFNTTETTSVSNLFVESNTTPKIFNDVVKINTEDYINVDLPEKNALTWVSGYLMKKCLEKHKCTHCEKYSQLNSDVLKNETLLSYFKTYKNEANTTFGNLKMPSDNFYVYIYQLDQKFCELFPTLSIEENVGHKIKLKLEEIPFDCPCSNFDQNYLLCLFVRLKIYYTLKYCNRNFKEQKFSRNSKTNRKVIILRHL